MPTVSRKQNEGFRISVVDVSKNYDVARKYGIRGVPTFIRFENGHEVNRRVGGMSPLRMEEFCRGL